MAKVLNTSCFESLDFGVNLFLTISTILHLLNRKTNSILMLIIYYCILLVLKIEKFKSKVNLKDIIFEVNCIILN